MNRDKIETHISCDTPEAGIVCLRSLTNKFSSKLIHLDNIRRDVGIIDESLYNGEFPIQMVQSTFDAQKNEVEGPIFVIDLLSYSQSYVNHHNLNETFYDIRCSSNDFANLESVDFIQMLSSDLQLKVVDNKVIQFSRGKANDKPYRQIDDMI